MSELQRVAGDLAANATIPENLRAQRPEGPRRHKILIIVDTQVDFVMRYGLLAIAGAEAIIVPGIGVLTTLDAGEYAAVLYTYDTHVAAKYIGSLEHLGDPELGIPGFRLHCEKGTPGWENVFNARLVPADIPVFELDKDVFDAWQKPSEETRVHTTDAQRRRVAGGDMPRDEFFEAMKRMGVDTAVVIGVASDFCVKDQIRGLLAHGFKVQVVAACTAGIMRDITTTIADEFPGKVEIVEANVPNAPPAVPTPDEFGMIEGESDADFEARHIYETLSPLTVRQREQYARAKEVSRAGAFAVATDVRTGRRGLYHFAEHFNFGAGWMMTEVDAPRSMVSSFDLDQMDPVDWSVQPLPKDKLYRMMATREVADQTQPA